MRWITCLLLPGRGQPRAETNWSGLLRGTVEVSVSPGSHEGHHIPHAYVFYTESCRNGKQEKFQNNRLMFLLLYCSTFEND